MISRDARGAPLMLTQATHMDGSPVWIVGDSPHSGAMYTNYHEALAAFNQRSSPMNIKLNPASVKDPGNVRLGGESPSFGPARK